MDNRETAGPPAIELRGVVKQYGDKPVVRTVDLSISAGECLVLVGHNGAGKTTLLKLMLGLTRPSAGSVSVLGSDPVTGKSVAGRNGLGYLPENVAFHEAMTGREVLRFYARLKHEPVAQCAAMLEQVGLTEAADRRVGTYSKGMRQRLGLAQAMLGHPRLLLLDEPTTGLDPALRRYFYEIIMTARDAGATVVISSHALHEVEARADRVAIIKQGALLACGTLAQLSDAVSLPVRVQVSVDAGKASAVADQLGEGVDIHKVNDRTVDMTCIGTKKMDLVRRIAGLGGVIHDVDIAPPRLDEIYMHYMNGMDS